MLRVGFESVDPDAVEPVIWNSRKGVVTVAFPRLAFATNDNRVVMGGHRHSRVTRIAGKIFSVCPDYEAPRVGMRVAAREPPVRIFREQGLCRVSLRRTRFKSEC